MIKPYAEEYEYREDVNGGGKSASGQGRETALCLRPQYHYWTLLKWLRVI